MKAIQIGGMIIPKEEKGPFVNVAFTLDLQSVEMLQNHGKNRSLTVRRAIKHYCKEIEPSPELVQKYREVIMERNELREVVEIQKEIINSEKKLFSEKSIPRQKQTIRFLGTSLPGKKKLLISRILKRLRDLFYKHRE